MFQVYNQNVESYLAVNNRYVTRRLTGVERYASEIVCRLEGKMRLIGPPGNLPFGFGHLWEQIVLPILIKPGEILWSPANTGPLLVTNQAVTLHDLSWLEHPEGYNPLFVTWYRFLLPRLIHRIRVVITTSQYIKLRIVRHFQISENRVKIIPGGVDRARFTPVKNAREVLTSYSLPDRFVLFVGTMARHKNLSGLCQAWQMLRQRYPNEFQDIQLVLAGASGRAFRKIDVPLTQGVVFPGYIAEKDLPALYTAALAFINPSFYEGFGLTLLEAMACGAPVLSSSGGALPEVAGDAAIFFDPYDMEEMIACIYRVIVDGELRSDLKKLGFARAARFSWDDSAAKIRHILQSVAS